MRLATVLLLSTSLGGCTGPSSAPLEVEEPWPPPEFGLAPGTPTPWETLAYEEARRFVNGRLRGAEDAPVRFTACRQASQIPGDATIDACDGLSEFLLPRMKAHMAGVMFGEVNTREELDAASYVATGAALRFLFTQEIGRALVQHEGLAVAGIEEDIGHRFATWILLQDANPALTDARARTLGEEAAFAGVDAFIVFARSRAEDWERELARADDVLCWTYGSDPDGLAVLAKPAKPERRYVPENRAASCPHEWNQMDIAFRTLLADRLTSSGGTRRVYTVM